MRAVLAKRFQDRHKAAPPHIQKLFGKQLTHLLRDLRHPSVRAKKYDETRGIWQARVDNSWRFYFRIDGDTYYILSIRKHSK